jgi:transposase
MSTKMDEDDGAHTLAVFRACLPRRERKAKDDRRFLEALHSFTVENVRWRALLERFGPWNSVWKRFDRLSKAGVFEAFFDMLASMSSTAHLIQMFDSTVVRAHVSAAGAKGGREGQALSRSRGGFITKIHAKSDASGDIIAFDLTGGEASDAASLRNPARYRARHSAPRCHLRQRLRRQGNRDAARARHRSRHPPQGQRKEQASLLRTHPHKARARIEQGVGRLKRFKRVALRCEKTERNFRSIVAFAAGRCLITFVHTA